MGIGAKIKEARLKIGLTQEQLANLIGVRQTAVGNYENDISHPREEILIKLFEALNVDANYIFEGQYKTDNKIITAPDEALLLDIYRQLTSSDRENVRNFAEYLFIKEQSTVGKINYKTMLVTENQIPYVMAAHNDDTSPKQKELMQKDIDEL